MLKTPVQYVNVNQVSFNWLLNTISDLMCMITMVVQYVNGNQVSFNYWLLDTISDLMHMEVHFVYINLVNVVPCCLFRIEHII